MECHILLTPLTEVHCGKICEKSKICPMYWIVWHMLPSFTSYFSSHHTKNCSWFGIYCTPNITFKGVNCLLNDFLFLMPLCFIRIWNLSHVCMYMYWHSFKKLIRQDVVHVLMFRELIYKTECNICIAQLVQNYLILITVSYFYNIGSKNFILEHVYLFFSVHIKSVKHKKRLRSLRKR